MGDSTNNREDLTSYNKPRRPSAETIAYLRGLPLDVEAAKHEIESFINQGDGGSEFPQNLAAALSAIDEIRMEIASLAGDELGSQSIEILAQIAAPYSELASRIMLSSCSGYFHFLATHRYGSHVVQSLLQVALSSSSDIDLATHAEAPQLNESSLNIPRLCDLVSGIVDELTPNASQLAIHVCGSHVLRSLLCAMGGVKLLSGPGSPNDNRAETGILLRGKKKSKKKRKRNPDSDSSSGTSHAGNMHIIHQSNPRVDPATFDTSLESLARAIVGGPSTEPAELQQLSCHPSAGPLLIVLLRVLTYASAKDKLDVSELANDENVGADFRLGIRRREPTFAVDSLAHEVAKHILCLQDGGANEQKHVGDVVYGLSGEPRGSHLLETLLRLSPDDLHAHIVKYGNFHNASTMKEYIEHDVSNYVVQALLTTVRNKESAESLLKIIERVIGSGLVLDATKRRRGILWRAAELAAKFRVGQEGLLKAIRVGGGVAFASESHENEPNNPDGKTKKQRKKTLAVELKAIVPKLVDLKQEGDRICIDAAGSRSVYHMLRFAPRLCSDVLAGVIEGLSSDELVFLARDGLGSRCILDGMLNGPTGSPVFAGALKSLLVKLRGNWVSLSQDRVGHHTVKKLFHALSKIDDKSILVEELACGGNRMNGNSMGRSVLEACFVEDYRENPKKWRNSVSALKARESSVVEDILSLPGDGENLSPRKKSKRKRKRQKKSDASETVDD